jgi:hypothetical protein
VAPWLGTQQCADALALLLWVHAFRHVALQIFSAQQFGFAVSNDTRDQIAGGDVIGVILASWLILTFYVPLLWVSLGLVVWQLYARRHEPLSLARA